MSGSQWLGILLLFGLGALIFWLMSRGSRVPPSGRDHSHPNNDGGIPPV